MLLRTIRATVAGTLLALTAVGCGTDAAGGADSPPQVQVAVGDQRVSLQPTQYCANGEGRRYDVKPPVVFAAPDTRVAITVPDAVAERGWQVQVFDEHLQQPIGNVPVAKGKAVFDLSTSDVVPPAFYLVVVEDKNPQCHYLSGSWPVGIVRAAPGEGGTAPGQSGTAPGRPSAPGRPPAGGTPSGPPAAGMPTG